ncbi:MAG TPA: ubiquinol-cytochrome c reductase iron-sulfur subunit [Steroidobacteraceae bacterium]|nr:ubiquinol-cytochrome c reductase iron-sulfur subunit [Steroidobacteraceae bacterium]
MADSGVIADEEFVVDESRRKLLVAATAATGAVGIAFAAAPFISSWLPSERAQALGLPTQFDLSKLEPGQMAVTVWRKQPIYIVHRTPEMVASLTNHDALLKDPGSKDSEQPAYAANVARSRTPAYLVLIGTCTHLGCLPKAHFEPRDPAIGSYWPGGWLCPCHGSRFDLAGRVFEGSPASVNLRVPPYSFPDARKLIIGVDQA